MLYANAIKYMYYMLLLKPITMELMLLNKFVVVEDNKMENWINFIRQLRQTTIAMCA